MKNNLKLTTRLYILILSLVLSSALFLSVSTIGSSEKKWLDLTNSTEGVYVIEHLNIDYRYDKTKYEVVPFVTEPYAVIKGDKYLINLLKWNGKPEFFIDLNGKLPGVYREKVQYTGINKKLKVEIYPSIINLRLMEQQTIKIVPTIELVGVEKLRDNYIVSVPKLLKEEVLIRDIQDKLNQVGQVKGVVDVSGMTETQDVVVQLTVYDRDGKEMKDINLIDKTVTVRIPIERKVTVVEEEVINKIVKVENISKIDEQKQPTPPKQEEKPKVDNNQKLPVREGVLSFINIPSDLNLINNTTGLKWSSDVKIDLKGFKAGKYEMTINDNGVKKVVKFDLIPKNPPKENTENEETKEDTGTVKDPNTPIDEETNNPKQDEPINKNEVNNQTKK